MPNDPDPTLIDDDSPELSRETILAMRPASEVLPPDVFAGLVAEHDAHAAHGSTLTLDREVVERLQALDDDWRGRAAALLRKAVGL
jgi:uncharacterized protein (DUF4415 family)